VNPEPGSVWRHYKREGSYEVIGVGKLQSAAVMKFYDGFQVVLYRDQTGELDCRPLLEWEQVVESESGPVRRFQRIEETTHVGISSVARGFSGTSGPEATQTDL